MNVSFFQSSSYINGQGESNMELDNLEVSAILLLHPREVVAGKTNNHRFTLHRFFNFELLQLQQDRSY